MIDWNRVRELREEVGEDDFAEVTGLFLEEAADVVARLRAGPEADTIREELHFLRGSASTLGFAELAGLCLEIEGKEKIGHADIDAVLTSYGESRARFLGGLPERLSA